MIQAESAIPDRLKGEIIPYTSWDLYLGSTVSTHSKSGKMGLPLLNEATPSS